MKLLVSACLLGCACRYDGIPKPLSNDILCSLKEKYDLIPVCPEIYGGLSTPRRPSERRGDMVVMNSGEDVTAQYHRGAQEALRLAKMFGCNTALLKQRSPSCGSGTIYDGSFTNTLTVGDGVAAELLKAHGLTVYSEDQLELLLR